MAQASLKRGSWFVDFYYPDAKHRRSKRCHSTGRRSAEEVATAKARKITEMLEDVRDGRMVPPDKVEDAVQWLYSEGKTRTAKPVAVVDEQAGTISTLADAYLGYRKIRTEVEINGKKALSIGSYSSDFFRLENIKKYCRNHDTESLRRIVTPEFLRGYQENTLKERGAVDAKHHLRTLKAVLLWGSENNLIPWELPRNLISKKWATINLGQPNTDSLTVEEVTKLLAASTGMTKLAILLGLNCGYYSFDISTLQHHMIDWETGLISRGRHKNDISSQHRLWPITAKLLRECATDPAKSDLVLLRDSGKPLVVVGTKEEGRPVKSDSIIKSFNVVRKKAGVALSFKALRKTSTQALEKHFQESPWLVELFLAHVETRTRKHYTGKSFDVLHPATDWLAEYLRLSEGGSLEVSAGPTTQPQADSRSTSS